MGEEERRRQDVECGGIRRLRVFNRWCDFLGFGDRMDRQFGPACARRFL
jgi:hypothetical protein